MIRLADTCDAELALADLVADLTARLEEGFPVDPAAVEAEYPEYAGELRRLLPALEALAATRHSAEAPNPPAPFPKREGGEISGGLLESSPPSRFGKGAGGLGGCSRNESGRLGDFRIVREIGRGGMGVVYEAEQISLNRRVALKVLPFAAALNPRQLQRFKTEAQAAAQLHHSNIVPVYAVGCEHGVHYYAMQLIDGHTLGDAIARLKEADAPAVTPPAGDIGSDVEFPFPGSECKVGGGRRSPPSGDSTTLDVLPLDHSSSPAVPAASTAVNLLAAATTVRRAAHRDRVRTVAELGAQAADALDYAHQVGVVHRDIKPANLMVDGRGHLWVTDFGLVRYADEGGLTVTGELLGTLRYMSPEQATARRGVVDHRTDVYALGATLYELLTLAPVHTGRTRAELFAQIVGEDPVPPRRHNPAVPVELETVVLKALAKDPARRYQTAEELAADLRRFLADLPVKARRPGPGERAWRWARRHHRLVAGTAVMAVFAVVCLAVSLAGIARERDEAVRRRAQARAAVDAMYTDVAERWLSGQQYLEPLQRDFLRRALAFYDEFARDAGADPAARLEAGRAALRVADIHNRLGEPDHAEPAYEVALDSLRRLQADHPGFAAARAEWAVTLNHRGVFRRGRGRVADALADFRAAADAFGRMAGDAGADPVVRDGLAGSRANVGLALHGLGRLADAEAEYAAALAAREELATADPAAPNLRHHLAACANNLALLSEDRGRPEDAERAYTRAVDLWKDLAAENAGVPAYRAGHAAGLHNRAQVRSALGRATDADRDAAEAVAIRDRLCNDFPKVAAYRQDLAAARHGHGVILAAAGRHAEAEQALKLAHGLRHALAAAHPADQANQQDLAATHHALGDLLAATGRWAAAEAAYRAALALGEKLTGGDAAEARQLDLAASRHALGRVRAAAGAAGEAEGLYREAAAGLVGRPDGGPARALALAAVELDLGRLLAGTGRGGEAGPIARRAADRAAAAATKLPSAPAPRELLAGAWALAGEVAAARPAEAAAAFEQALAARRWLADRPVARPRDLADLAWFLTTCPLERYRDPAGAVAAARSAAGRAPQDARPWTRLGAALCRAGDWRAAIDSLDRAEKLKPGGDRTGWLFRALAHHRLGETDLAGRWAAKVAAAGPGAAVDAEWARLRAEAADWLDGYLVRGGRIAGATVKDGETHP